MLAGWTELTAAFLEQYDSPLSVEQLHRFYDGQQPDWHHASAPDLQIPRRQVAIDALAQYEVLVAPTMVLLVGTDGQGKSTVLRQVSVALAKAGRRVLFRSPGTPLDVDAIAALPPGSQWILASDDSDEIADSLEEAAQRIETDRRRDIHWLLTARYEDWKVRFRRETRNVEPSWGRYADLWPEVGAAARVLALSTADAQKVVDAWSAAGALGALADLPEAERAEALEDASHHRRYVSDATFLGGALDRRYGAEGMAAHVEAVLERLAQDDHRLGAGHNMRQAFLYLAAADAAGVDGVDLYVLADLVGVDRAERDQLLAKLGHEGVAAGSAGVIRARHPAVARAAITLAADGRFGTDLSDIFRRLINGTGETGTELKGLAAGGAIMNCGPLLSNKLQQLQIPAAEADSVARSAADEAAAVLSNLLLFSVARARTYRETGEADDALTILRAEMADAMTKEDWNLAGRSYLCEMSVCEALVGHVTESIVLAGLSVANVEGLGRVSMTEAKLALTQLGQCCVAMDEEAFSLPFQGLARACPHLGAKVTPKWDQAARLDFHNFGLLADRFDVPECSSAEAVFWMADAIVEAKSQLDDTELEALWKRLLPGTERPPFGRLKITVNA
ncbi:MAG: hypothetical protein M3N98_01410 [Actinomycetota bacterium]|nr:hypothetical protein [Actinomycetota bacterium]